VKARAFQINPADNVATLLDDAPPGSIMVRGGATGPQMLELGELVPRGHKVATTPIASGDAVIKFGVRIGHATRAIAPGEWVHLHNLASDIDTRSGSLDLHSGAPTDTASAYV
jgi:hypothetical protein